MESRTFTINLELSKTEIENYLDNAHRPKVSFNKAQDFYKTLCFAYNKDEDCTCQSVVTAEHIAKKFKTNLELTRELCDAMVFYGITERQGGGYVI